jgi:hypothetical protein
MYNLTSIMWVKNETKYIPEWIEFHLIQGVDHFILYNDNSTDGFYEILDSYIKEGILEVRTFPEHLTRQDNILFWTMNHCIDEQKNKTKWAFFHAIDEFLFLKDGGNLVDFLKKYEPYGALGVEWEMFGPSGHIDMPNDLVINSYTKAERDLSHHIKTIFMPEHTISYGGNPHTVMLNGMSTVNERFTPLGLSPFNNQDPGFDKIKLHHYWTKSRNEFIEKRSKGYLDLPGKEFNDGETMLDHLNLDGKSTHECKDLFKYSDLIKEKLVKRYGGEKDLLSRIVH